MDKSFGLWFSGFSDGESSFIIDYHFSDELFNKERFSPKFQIALRADDKEILNLMIYHLGFGKIYYKKCKLPTNPQFVFYVSSINDCVKLIEVFDRFPLRSKKRMDYLVWREFVLYKFNNNAGRKNNTVDNEVLRAYFNSLREIRKFPRERED